jgi:hypothetical protein
LSEVIGLTIAVNPLEKDAEYRHDLAQELANDLREVKGLDSIQETYDVAGEVGTKGALLQAGLLIIGGIAVSANLVMLIDTIGKWMNRDKGRRTLSITIKGDKFDIEDLDEKTQEELIAWLKARAQRN